MSGPLDGWTVESSVDDKGEHFEIRPPEVSDAVAEAIGAAVETLCREYLAGKRAWADFPEEARPWLCHLHLAAVQALVDRLPADKTYVLAVRFVEALLAARGRIEGASENERVAKARDEVAKYFLERRGVRLNRDTLNAMHRRGRRGRNKNG